MGMGTATATGIGIAKQWKLWHAAVASNWGLVLIACCGGDRISVSDMVFAFKTQPRWALQEKKRKN